MADKRESVRLRLHWRWAEAQLSESEEKFRTIFDKASNGILLADTESKRFLMGNEASSNESGREDLLNLM